MKSTHEIRQTENGYAVFDKNTNKKVSKIFVEMKLPNNMLFAKKEDGTWVELNDNYRITEKYKNYNEIIEKYNINEAMRSVDSTNEQVDDSSYDDSTTIHISIDDINNRSFLELDELLSTSTADLNDAVVATSEEGTQIYNINTQDDGFTYSVEEEGLSNPSSYVSNPGFDIPLTNKNNRVIDQQHVEVRIYDNNQSIEFTKHGDATPLFVIDPNKNEFIIDNNSHKFDKYSNAPIIKLNYTSVVAKSNEDFEFIVESKTGVNTKIVISAKEISFTLFDSYSKPYTEIVSLDKPLDISLPKDFPNLINNGSSNQIKVESFPSQSYSILTETFNYESIETKNNFVKMLKDHEGNLLIVTGKEICQIKDYHFVKNTDGSFTFVASVNNKTYGYNLEKTEMDNISMFIKGKVLEDNKYENLNDIGVAPTAPPTTRDLRKKVEEKMANNETSITNNISSTTVIQQNDDHSNEDLVEEQKPVEEENPVEEQKPVKEEKPDSDGDSSPSAESHGIADVKETEEHKPDNKKSENKKVADEKNDGDNKDKKNNEVKEAIKEPPKGDKDKGGEKRPGPWSSLITLSIVLLGIFGIGAIYGATMLAPLFATLASISLASIIVFSILKAIDLKLPAKGTFNSLTPTEKAINKDNKKINTLNKQISKLQERANELERKSINGTITDKERKELDSLKEQIKQKKNEILEVNTNIAAYKDTAPEKIYEQSMYAKVEDQRNRFESDRFRYSKNCQMEIDALAEKNDKLTKGISAKEEELKTLATDPKNATKQEKIANEIEAAKKELKDNQTKMEQIKELQKNVLELPNPCEIQNKAVVDDLNGFIPEEILSKVDKNGKAVKLTKEEKEALTEKAYGIKMTSFKEAYDAAHLADQKQETAEEHVANNQNEQQQVQEQEQQH